jgi:hypothetical protein
MLELWIKPSQNEKGQSRWEIVVQKIGLLH